MNAEEFNAFLEQLDADKGQKTNRDIMDELGIDVDVFLDEYLVPKCAEARRKLMEQPEGFPFLAPIIGDLVVNGMIMGAALSKKNGQNLWKT